MTKPLLSKVVLLGDMEVGKTSILLRHNGQGFNTKMSSTIGASFCRTQLMVNSREILLLIWDTAGQERFRSMAPLYYRNANAALIVYDISSKETFSEARSLVKELRDKFEEPIIMCIIGNKTDLEEQREVDTRVGQEYAKSVGALFFETSALSNKGVEEAFKTVATQLVQKQLTVSKDSNAATVYSVENKEDQKKPSRCC